MPVYESLHDIALTYLIFVWMELEVVEEHGVVVKVLYVVPVRDVVLYLASVAMEDGMARSIWQPG